MSRYYSSYGHFPKAPTVAERRRDAARARKRLHAADPAIEPIILGGARTIAHTFWGKAWCTHLDSLAGIANRLGRGRSYVRHDCVVDLRIHAGEVVAKVQGSALYEVRLKVKPLPTTRWTRIVDQATGQVDSVLDLLGGRLSGGVLGVLCSPKGGVFPRASELEPSCSCPDYARVCKHVAAVFYGVGARLDDQPDLLFRLRQVDEDDLVAAAAPLVDESGEDDDFDDLADLFGIDLDLEDDSRADLLADLSAETPRVEAAPASATATRETEPAHPTTATPTEPIKVELYDALFAALVAAMHGAEDFPSAQARVSDHQSLLKSCVQDVPLHLAPLASLAQHIPDAEMAGMLRHFVRDVLQGEHKRQSLYDRLGVGRGRKLTSPPSLWLTREASGALYLHGRDARGLLDGNTTTAGTLHLLAKDEAGASSRVTAQGHAWAVELTTGDSALAREVRLFFADAASIDYDDVPHELVEHQRTTLRTVDWLDWLPEATAWAGRRCVVSTDGTDRPRTWLTSLAPRDVAPLIEAPSTGVVLRDPPNTEASFQPFVHLARTLLRSSGAGSKAKRAQWQRGPGQTLRGLKAVLNRARV